MSFSAISQLFVQIYMYVIKEQYMVARRYEFYFHMLKTTTFYSIAVLVRKIYCCYHLKITFISSNMGSRCKGGPVLCHAMLKG